MGLIALLGIAGEDQYSKDSEMLISCGPYKLDICLFYHLGKWYWNSLYSVGAEDHGSKL